MIDVLIIDNNLINRNVLSGFCNINNYSKLTACDSKEALSMLKKKNFNIIIIDTHIGEDIIKLIRNTLNLKIPIILTTSKKLDIMDIKKYIIIGVNKIIETPILFPLLKKNINELLL